MPSKLDCLIQEIDNCSYDPLYFFQYVTIQHQSGGKIKGVKLFPKQKYILFSYLDGLDLIILKSRQTGVSTLFDLITLWEINFHSGKEILILSKGERESKKHIRVIKQYYDSLPGWLRAKTLKSNEHEFALSISGKKKTMSIVTALPVTKDIGRSFSASLVIIDEAAFIQNMDDVWPSISLVTATGGQIVVISTPKQVNSWFHRKWKEALEGENEFIPIEYSWKELPIEEFKRRGFDSPQEWYKYWCRKLRRKKEIASELDMSFITSGDNYIDATVLEKIERHVILNPNHWSKFPLKKDYNEKLFIYEEPVPNYKYVLGADVSEGIEKNYSTFYILRQHDEKIVAEFRDNTIIPTKFADLIYKYAKLYNDALLNIELNNHGRVVVGKLIETYNYYRIMSTYDQVTQTFSDKFGWEESGKSKQVLLTHFREKVEENYIGITYRLANECMVLIGDEKGARAMKGCHDDLVIAYGLALIACKYGEKFLMSRNIGGETPNVDPIVDYASSGLESLVFDNDINSVFDNDNINYNTVMNNQNMQKLLKVLDDIVII